MSVTIPMLPAADLDTSIAFYEAMGFHRTYRQLRPNPYAVVEWEDVVIHLFGIEGFDPADSYGSAGIGVEDVGALHAQFAAGLRQMYGRLPVKGIPRLLRPRAKKGTVTGFSVVDPGGNWLRVFTLGDREEDAETGGSGLQRAVRMAARLGDAHGDEAMALKALESGLLRFPDAPPLDHVKARLYRAELLLRIDDRAGAEAAVTAARALPLTAEEQALIADELAHVQALLAEADEPDGPDIAEPAEPGGGLT